MRLVTLVLALLLPVAAGAQDISKINGAVSVAAGEHAGDVSTVNGSVTIADHSTARDVSAVNGAVELGAGAQADAVQTVNGAISLGQGGKVRGRLHSTNGAISLHDGSEVSGDVGNVNGTIELEHAHVGGNIETTAGNIFVGADSQVDGGITVHEQHRWSNANRPPRIVIGPHAIVRGTLDFHRDVILEVSDSAQIGAVKGATAMRFSGAQPLQ